MNDCFRFLINVDQCLNKSNFDIFFYQLESRKKFHLNEVRLFGDSGGSSLKAAIEDIRMYLNKYSYFLRSYRIIVTMRKQYESKPKNWSSTLLYRLIQLNYELENARIFISSKENNEKALNLVMLYEADMSLELPNMSEAYINSQRFVDDCCMLFSEIGIDISKKVTRKSIVEALDQYESRNEYDAALYEFVRRFLLHGGSTIDEFNMDGSFSVGGYVIEQAAPAVKGEDTAFKMQFIAYLKERLQNYQVYEMQIDKNDRRSNILSLLRVVEFIERSTDISEYDKNDGRVLPLSQRCVNNWNDIQSDDGLEQYYSSMLYRYRQGLLQAEMDLENPEISAPGAKAIPTVNIPDDNEIDSGEGPFSSDSPDKQGYDYKAILEKFISNKFNTAHLADDWDSVYQRLKKSLGKMDRDLREYARKLSSIYSSALEKRKKETAYWKSNHYIADENCEKLLSDIENKRTKRLREMQNPHISPSLKFQDQLNMENALEQANLDIHFYISSMRSVTFINLIILIAVVAVISMAHYTFLQPYVFEETASLGEYLVYFAALVVIMLFTWGMPHRYFRSRLKKCVGGLMDSMDVYIKGYFDKAKNFKRYINLLNQLDYINRYDDLLNDAKQLKSKLDKEYLWHRYQVKSHLTKLKFFQGLIDICEERPERRESLQKTLPAVVDDEVASVRDCPIYWPQN